MKKIQPRTYSIGDVVDGRFKLVKSLGEGGFGKVFKAEDASGTPCALKILKIWEFQPEMRENFLARFEMEYETGLIDSPYLVKSIAYGYDGGDVPYMALEFCPGGDLRIVPENTDLNVVAHQVLYGLKALHKNGKVHRDLKPENILIKSKDLFVLSDFGISGDRNRRLTLRDASGKILVPGTWAYMPPEQAEPPSKDAIVLPTTDTFAFGVTMYFLLTGEFPFGPLNDHNDLSRYAANMRLGRWNKNAIAGSPFANAIAGCLIPNFKQRLQSVDDVLALLPPYQSPFGGGAAPVRQNTFEGIVRPDGFLLRVMQGEEYGKTYDLSALLSGMNFITMGRLDKYVHNDIQLREDLSTYVSRRHCTIARDGNNFKIIDGQKDNRIGRWERSTNGTYVNSKEVSEYGYYLSPGDIITIGDIKLRFEPYEKRCLS